MLQAFIHQRTEKFEALSIIGTAHCLGCLERPTLGEHPEPGELGALVRIQQALAPLDRVPERLLALR